jgi:hypothetical protein
MNDFWKHDGTTFDDVSAAVMETLSKHEALGLQRSLHVQWTSPSSTRTSGWDNVIYILRQLARAFSSNEHIAEMVNMTGCRNSSKNFIVMLVGKFLGDSHMNYTASLDKDYLSKPPAKASSSADHGRNPALA